MCGRVFQRLSLTRLIQLSRANFVRNRGNYHSSANVCPTNFIPALRQMSGKISEGETMEAVKESGSEPIEYEYTKEDEGTLKEENSKKMFHKELAFLRWGMETAFQFLINARIEEIHEKKTFRKIVQENRCAVLVEGYFEWTPTKRPYAFKHKSKDHLFLAAFFTDKDTIVLLTREVCGYLSDVHHRMPVFLDEKDLDVWLDSGTYKFSQILDKVILNESKSIWKEIDHYPIAPYLNDIKNKSDKCLMTETEYEELKRKGGIHKFFKKISDGGGQNGGDHGGDHAQKTPKDDKLSAEKTDTSLKTVSGNKPIIITSPVKNTTKQPSLSSVKKRPIQFIEENQLSRSVRTKSSYLDGSDKELQRALSAFMKK